MASTEQTPTPFNGMTPLQPRKFKASDLPLPSATRSAIEGLAHSFKKKGGYDAIRKQVWEKFEQSDYEAQVTKSILEVAEQEVERNPNQLLTLERRKAAALIDGALDRSGVYQQAEAVLDRLIDLKAIEARMRELRQLEIGAEKAEEERIRGSKTNEEYAVESTAKLAAREQLRQEIRLKEKQIQEEKLKIEREERKKRERERERELEVAEAKRKEERDARRREREKKEEERQRDREKERDERRRVRERDRDRDHDRGLDARRRSRSRSRSHHRDRDRDRSRRRRDRSPREERDRGKTEDIKKQLTKEDLERLEQEALADLLRESNKDNAKPLEMEIDQALAPPPRRTKPASAIQPIRRDSTKPSDPKKGPELVKTESRDSVMKDPKTTKETKDEKSRESKDSLEPREIKDIKDSKDSKIKIERKSSPTPSRQRRDQSRSVVDDQRSRSPVRDDRDKRARSPSKTRHDRRDSHRDRSRSPKDRTERRDRSRSKLASSHPEPSRSTRRARSQGRDKDKDHDSEKPRDRVGEPEKEHKGERGQTIEHEKERGDRPTLNDAETWKQSEIKRREQEAKAYLKAQKEAREKGLPVPGLDDRRSTGDRSPEIKRPRVPDEIDRYRPGERDRDRGSLTSEETSIPNEIESGVTVIGRSDVIETMIEIVIVIAAVNDGEVEAEVEVDAASANAAGTGTGAVTMTKPALVPEIDTATVTETETETGIEIEIGTGIGIVIRKRNATKTMTEIGAADAKEARPAGIDAGAVEAPELYPRH
ncbi:hypothetical protein E0Z10_g1875 [Xylaria hypoxylon]|uniref:BOD1/SHG1 domain-containing protein n=1 Tax=Xylaria hypoxylon TaxID=37992 RepID=A0A4Z0ZBK0_9PEZI|nr:hypothetical protein E0Z10_g1875 [Xylaria hypoxylon]